MAERTDNAALKSSLAKAAERNVLPTSTVTVTPAEARANDGFYGVDIYEVLLPGGLETAIENIGVDEIVANIDYDAALAQVDLTNVAKAIDWDKALDKDGDGSADVDTKAAIKALPLGEVVSNVDVGAVKQKLTVFDIIGVYNNPKANLPKVLERVDADKLLADALAKTGIDKEQTAKDVLKASGTEPDQVVQNVSKQQPVRDAVKAELNKVDYKTLLLDAMKKAGKEPSIDLILGYNPSDVLSAAKEAFKEVGPAVTAPILTARPAFTSCSAPKDGQSEASTPSSGVRGAGFLPGPEGRGHRHRPRPRSGLDRQRRVRLRHAPGVRPAGRPVAVARATCPTPPAASRRRGRFGVRPPGSVPVTRPRNMP